MKANGDLDAPFDVPVLADAVIVQGDMLCIEVGVTAGFEPGKVDTGLRCIGVAAYDCDATGFADGDKKITALPGRAGGFKNHVGDELTATDYGNLCYMTGPRTVAKTDGTGTRSPAGVFLGFDSLGTLVVGFRIDGALP